jgi:hypothetical protein
MTRSRTRTRESGASCLPSEDTSAADIPSKHLAGYRLGLLSRTLGLWQAQLVENPFVDLRDASVPLALEQLDDALVALADEGQPGVLNEIRHQVTELGKLHAEVMKQPGQVELIYGDGLSGLPTEARRRRDQLRSLADRALAAGNVVTPWYRLGVAIGSYQAHLSRLHSAQPLPGLRNLVRATQAVPAEERRLVPPLEALATLSPRLDTLRPIAYLRQALETTSKFKSLDAQAHLYDANHAMLTLDHAIQGALRKIRPPSKPHWDERCRQLSYGGVVCKKYKKSAPDQHQILKEFEARGWPSRIENPLAPREKLRDTLKDLQRSVHDSPLVFKRDGEEIIWRPREQLEDS